MVNMMELTATRRAEMVVQLLEHVISGETMPEMALQRWPNIDVEDDDLLALSWHDLTHFAADGDIRSRDLDYAKYQTGILSRRIQEIRDRFGLGLPA